MQIHRLDHVNLRTRQMARMIAWYTDILGLTVGPRPASLTPGAWLYAGDTAVVHLVDVGKEDGIGGESLLKLEHFAFTASGAEAFQARLTAAGEHHSRSDNAQTGTTAFNVRDPDGTHIHVDFRLDE
ncbi:Glyoxalase/Bleomycin resistance protein/Dioxygenase superfamily protein [Jannaschia faecimaris]|uniref:Glyoxalase/Bleomycin resistance protein/Dioxygenase superfamily protein n=1 Tax=Jannaschia faecimaris TaxID=1244108 RepID=A0A1H3MNH0_9RHOB|nr:VOC family protein [Jannaschia faecimaris]SDY77988.1 Glyoxalase/Bleomycin resistance protein/Dioxygenase superfamily protein [Jannaschia faecimaris]